MANKMSRATRVIKGTGPRRFPPPPVTDKPPSAQDAIDAWRQSRSANNVDVPTPGQRDTGPGGDDSKPTS